jgi:hypothetical protein
MSLASQIPTIFGSNRRFQELGPQIASDLFQQNSGQSVTWGQLFQQVINNPLFQQEQRLRNSVFTDTRQRRAFIQAVDRYYELLRQLQTQGQALRQQQEQNQQQQNQPQRLGNVYDQSQGSAAATTPFMNLQQTPRAQPRVVQPGPGNASIISQQQQFTPQPFPGRRRNSRRPPNVNIPQQPTLAPSSYFRTQPNPFTPPPRLTSQSVPQQQEQSFLMEQQYPVTDVDVEMQNAEDLNNVDDNALLLENSMNMPLLEPGTPNPNVITPFDRSFDRPFGRQTAVSGPPLAPPPPPTLPPMPFNYYGNNNDSNNNNNTALTAMNPALKPEQRKSGGGTSVVESSVVDDLLRNYADLVELDRQRDAGVHLRTDTDLIHNFVEQLQAQTQQNQTISNQLSQTLQAQEQFQLDPRYNWLTQWQRWMNDLQLRPTNESKDLEYLFAFVPVIVNTLQSLNQAYGIQFGPLTAQPRTETSVPLLEALTQVGRLVNYQNLTPEQLRNAVRNNPVLGEASRLLLLDDERKQEEAVYRQIESGLRAITSDLNLLQANPSISSTLIEPLQNKFNHIERQLQESRRRGQLMNEIVYRLPRLIQTQYS